MRSTTVTSRALIKKYSVFILFIALTSSPFITGADDDTQALLEQLRNEENQQELVLTDTQDEVVETDDTEDDYPEEEYEQDQFAGLRIADIVVTGNKQIPTQAILYRIPYRVGDTFDPIKSRDLLKRLYKDLKRLRSISLSAEAISDKQMILYVDIEEKKLLKDYQFIGSTQITSKEILEKVPLADMPALDPEELKVLAQKIKKLYSSKGYHKVDIQTSLEVDEEDKAVATFTFTEYPRSPVKRITFNGNTCINGKTLRSVIFSREDWILSFLDHAGTYQPEMVEADRHMIEQHYQNQGYLNAKVVDAHVTFDECNCISIEFDIVEGDQYCVGSVSVEPIDGLTEEQLLACIPLKEGEMYSREKVVDSIKTLEHIWGSRGYLFANVEPSIVPNDDTKTVSISFRHDLGDRVFLNKLTIVGNKKTRDKIIRRQILIDEGDLITETALESSKTRVESLGYFQIRDGVNWKTHRLDNNLADLELVLKEDKTGHFSTQLGYGGTANLASPADALSAEISLSDSNIMGYGWSTNITGRFSKNEKTFVANITQPWLFDKPILAAFDIYHKRLGYEELRIANSITEHRSGVTFTTGFATVLPRLYFTDIFVRFNLGLDSIRYDGFNVATAQIEDDPLADPGYIEDARVSYTRMLKCLFRPGYLGWFTLTVGQEKKNHPAHPSRGYAWAARSITNFPTLNTRIAFQKLDFDYHWYTPLIGEYDLIFHWHNYLGFVIPFRKNTIPYGELFHIGGPSSVRGFLFGDISPRFRVDTRTDSIGASKTLFVNAELIFPIRQDMSFKGVFFYDGGAGWDNPYVNASNARYIINNNFDYRHSIGAGIRMLNPVPVKIDVGFKLDPRRDESPYEVHFGMTYDW